MELKQKIEKLEYLQSLPFKHRQERTKLVIDGGLKLLKGEITQKEFDEIEKGEDNPLGFTSQMTNDFVLNYILNRSTEHYKKFFNNLKTN